MVLALITDRKVFKKTIKTSRGLSESLPKLLTQFLKKNQIKLKDIKKVAVVRGPGSFVGTRTGVVFANTLAWALNLSLIGLKADELPKDLGLLRKAKYSKKIVTPHYSVPPNITRSAKGQLK